MKQKVKEAILITNFLKFTSCKGVIYADGVNSLVKNIEISESNFTEISRSFYIFL